jgi:hypothetical protein
VTFYESNAEVRPTGQEPAEYTEIPDPPPPPAPPAPSDQMDEPPAGVTTTELASEAVELPTRGPLLAGLAVAGFGVLLLVVIRFVRSRRS